MLICPPQRHTLQYRSSAQCVNTYSGRMTFCHNTKISRYNLVHRRELLGVIGSHMAGVRFTFYILTQKYGHGLFFIIVNKKYIKALFIVTILMGWNIYVLADDAPVG